MRSRCILFPEFHLSIIPQRVQSAPSVTKCGSAISATLVHTSSKFVGFEFITILCTDQRKLNTRKLACHESYIRVSTHQQDETMIREVVLHKEWMLFQKVIKQSSSKGWTYLCWFWKECEWITLPVKQTYIPLKCWISENLLVTVA